MKKYSCSSCICRECSCRTNKNCAICPYCIAAKNFLKSKGQQWTEVRIDLDPAEREKMVAKTRRTSVPQIFVGDVHVGGYDDMMALHRAGKLLPLLDGQAPSA